MIKIALCDDETSVTKELSAFIENYKEESSCDIEYSLYQSPLELMAGIESGLRFDILVLDVIMPGENGMELAREIREYDSHAKIIFLTSSAEFAVESYSVGAYYYLLKPFTEKELLPVLEKAVSECEKSKNEKLVLKCKTGITAIFPGKIEYCEVIGHSLFLHMHDKTVLESPGKLDELEAKLMAFGGFLRIHRSYIVNMEYVRNITSQTVEMSLGGVQLPVPHGKYNEIKNAYLDYVFEKEGMLL